MRLRWWQWRRKWHCPHADVAGIYGDAIFMAGWYRLLCRDCGRYLDGPVAIAEQRTRRP